MRVQRLAGSLQLRCTGDPGRLGGFSLGLCLTLRLQPGCGACGLFGGLCRRRLTHLRSGRLHA